MKLSNGIYFLCLKYKNISTEKLCGLEITSVDDPVDKLRLALENRTL